MAVGDLINKVHRTLTFFSNIQPLSAFYYNNIIINYYILPSGKIQTCGHCPLVVTALYCSSFTATCLDFVLSLETPITSRD